MNNGFTNFPIAQAEFVILSSDDEMIALEEVFRIVYPNRDFRQAIDPVLKSMLEMCFHERAAAEKINLYAKTNYFASLLPYNIRRSHYVIYTAHSDGSVDTTDRRQDKRSVRQILARLAHNLGQQLGMYRLYDEHGNLMFDYDPLVPFGSLEIRLRRL